MLILGIGGLLHDYNCALVDLETGRVALYEAERASRRKHHVLDSPDDALGCIEVCCAGLGVGTAAIDTVVFAHTDPFPAKDWIRDRLGPSKRYVDLDHHLAHAAAAFFASGFDSAAIVSMDGFGDGSSGVIAHGRGNRIEVLTRIDDADSIGLEYTRATYHLGLGGYGAEGKTQGLAPYGEPALFDAYMNEIELLATGDLRLSPLLRSASSRLSEEGGYLNTLLLNNAFLNRHARRRIHPEPIEPVHRDLAASIQKVLEHVVAHQCAVARRLTGESRLVLGGGCMMNSSLNGVLLESGGFERVFPLPMASDRGTGLGAALHHAHAVLDAPRFFTLDSVFHGGRFDDGRALRAMRDAGLETAVPDDIVDLAARTLAEGRIIGWFQGRSEMGARALGNRSILADPRQAAMKDVLNARVKHREPFRPFAPACPEEEAGRYFETHPGRADLGFMTFTVKARPAAVAEAPATVHVDGTARLQTVADRSNPRFAALVRRFGALTGTPVLLNTSFNDNGEPIVESPEDAVRSFLNADMDLLCIGGVAGWRR